MAETILKKMVTINGAEYTITSDGKVYGKEGKEISVRPNTSGYASFTAGRKGKRTRKEVHRLVAVLFVDNPNHYDEVDHKDSDRMNPRADNLEWVTRAENIRRIYERRGDINKKRKLTEDIVVDLRRKYKAGVSVPELVREYKLPRTTIRNAVKGNTWKNVPM